ncbi:sugar transferase [Geodermatophilus sp. TF02-6]|nr:sugar transferase [Geodermatophilus sp. TF02-6]
MRTGYSPHLVAADDDLGVRRLAQLRPVPPSVRPPAIAGAADPAPGRPVYDPYGARRRRSPEWLINYTAALVMGDVIAAVAAACLTVALTGPVSVRGQWLAAAGALAWPVLLMLLGTFAERRHGTGADEYRRVGIAGVIATAVAAYAAHFPALAGVHDLLLLGVPTATVLTLVSRVLSRWRLHAARRRGHMTKQVVLVGRDVAVLDLVRRLRRDPTAGLQVLGACVPRPGDATDLRHHGIPVLGGLHEVMRVLDDVHADAVVVASASETAGRYLRELAWQLEGTNIELLASPGLIEVAPNRLQIRPTISLPLLHVREPRFRGHRHLVKTALDRLAATVLLLLGAPLFLALVVAIRVTSRGPAFYRQRRIGKRGRPFDMLKFRSMVVDAESALDSLLVFNEGNAVLFKMRRDPRVTAVGRFLRRYSLDELPQLINILKGDMSFVGPRPALAREVTRYGADMQRRLLVKPGLTGLWQVSGRSNLSWDEAVELDIRYVENWSLGLDLVILLRTVRAVLRSHGAY